MKFEVIVQPKDDVLDPEARALSAALAQLGYDDIRDVKVAKRYVLDLDPTCQSGEQLAQDVAQKHLANPVAEDFVVRRVEP